MFWLALPVREHDALAGLGLPHLYLTRKSKKLADVRADLVTVRQVTYPRLS